MVRTVNILDKYIIFVFIIYGLFTFSELPSITFNQNYAVPLHVRSEPSCEEQPHKPLLYGKGPA